MAHPCKDKPKLVAPREGLIIAFPIHAWYQLDVFPWTAAKRPKLRSTRCFKVSTPWSGVIVGPSCCPVCPCPCPDFGGSIGVMFWAFVSAALVLGDLESLTGLFYLVGYLGTDLLEALRI